MRRLRWLERDAQSLFRSLQCTCTAKIRFASTWHQITLTSMPDHYTLQGTNYHTTGVKTERGPERRRSAAGRETSWNCYRRERTENTPRSHRPPFTAPSCPQHNSISCKNVLRYSWMSSVAQSSVSLRQSFSPAISARIVGAALRPGKEGKEEGVFQWHEPPADNCHPPPPRRKPPLTHTHHTHTRPPLPKPKQLLSIKVWICH